MSTRLDIRGSVATPSARISLCLARMAAAAVPLGAHVDRSGVLDAAADLGADCMQIFLSDPGSWRKPPPHPEADAIRASHDRHLRPRALPHQRLLAEAERPLRLAQDPPADLRRGCRDRGQGRDRPRRPCRGRHRGGTGPLAALAGDARDGGLRAAREHGRRRERRRPPLRRARAASGRRSAMPTTASTSASVSTPATRTPPARSSPTRSSGPSRSPAGSTSCTPTTRATRPAPAPIATSASARARSIPTRCAE